MWVLSFPFISKFMSGIINVNRVSTDATNSLTMLIISELAEKNGVPLQVNTQIHTAPIHHIGFATTTTLKFNPITIFPSFITFGSFFFWLCLGIMVIMIYIINGYCRYECSFSNRATTAPADALSARLYLQPQEFVPLTSVPPCGACTGTSESQVTIY